MDDETAERDTTFGMTPLVIKPGSCQHERETYGHVVDQLYMVIVPFILSIFQPLSLYMAEKDATVRLRKAIKGLFLSTLFCH